MSSLGKNKGGVGIAVYACTDLQYTPRPDLIINNNDIFELCFVELKINKTPTVAG